MRKRVVLFLLSAGGVALAQQSEPEIRRAIPVIRATPEPEIRRALPVEPYQNPQWMERVQPSPTPRVPLGPEPGFTPYRPSGRIEVAPTPEATPQPEPSAAPAPVETPLTNPGVGTMEPDEDGVIRLSPSNTSSTTNSAAEQQLERANGIYARKIYDYAATEYEKFLISFPDAPERDQALFRLAESHRLLGNDTAARDGYLNVLKLTRKGEFAGAAAFRLGEYLYADRLFEPASIQFQTAEAEAGSAEVRLSATYQLARSLEKLKQTDAAMAKYKEVIAVKKDNPYRDYARLSLAELTAQAGKKKEALEEFADLATDPGPAGVRAEAAVKAAALAAELGDAKRASSFFVKALAMPDLGDWKPIAVLGALRTYYASGNYEKVTQIYTQEVASLPPDTRPEAMLLAANSYRQAGKAAEAKAVYDRLITEFPEASQAQNARFQKVLNMYQLNDPQTLSAVDEFLKQATDPRERAQATLLKAETLFKVEKYAEALPLYSEVAVSGLDEDVRGKALLKLGWCQSKTGQFSAAADTYTSYLKKYPKASVTLARVQRGLARQELKDYAAALVDFDDIITKSPDAKERELALQQKALILGQQKDYPAMTAAFRQLLKEYPKSAAAAQANYWIGWAAYNEKNYKEAIAGLEAARKLDPAQYGNRAGLSVILCYYYLEDEAGLKSMIEQNKSIDIPVEVTRWLGRKSFAKGDYAGAARYLQAAVKDGKTAEPDILIELAEALIRQEKAAEAAPYVASFLQVAREPYTRARGLYAQSRIALAAKNFPEASRLSEEGILLQPEGPLNAEGRLLAGEIAYAQGEYTEAAKAFLTVAVLYDDPAITPRALEKAADAYRKAGNALEAEKALRELQSRFPDFKKSPRLTIKDPP